MPTLKDARRIAQLLGAKDAIEEWLDTISAEKDGFVSFGNIEECTKEDGSGGEGPYEGGLILPRNVAVRMLGREIEAIHEELIGMGVTDHPANEIAVAAE